MSRTLTAGMAAMLGTRAHSRCNMMRLDLRDGTSIGITDHNRDLAFDLGDGELAYSAKTGILSSDISLATGLESDNYEVTGPIGDVITQEALLGGRLDRAEVRLFQVNWKVLTDGPIRLMLGNVTDARAEGGRFVLEIRNQFDRYNQTVGNVITGYCSGKHASCCVNIGAELETTVTAVAGPMEFTVADILTDRHIPGKVWFTSGSLAGTLPVETFSHSDNTLTLFSPLVEAPQVGDTLIVKEGCSLTRAMCKERFNNVINFRGYPEVPGTDQVLRNPIPGQGND